MSNITRDNLLKQSLTSAEKCAQRVISILEGEEQAAALKKLYEITEAYCMLEERAAISASSIQAAKAMLDGKENDFMSFEDAYNLQFEERACKINDMKLHPKYIKFDKSVKATLAQGEDDGSEESGDEDLQVTEAEVNTIDPISQQTMVSPVKNKHCGHSYEKATILQMLLTKKRMRCPYVGCPNGDHFGPDDLEEDERLKQILKRRRAN